MVVLYDADCGFCTAAARWLRRVATRRLQTVPWQSWPHLAEHGITPEAAAAELHVVEGDRVWRGHEGVAAALGGTRPLPLRLAGRAVALPALAPLARTSYRWVAGHRHQLPGGSPTCRLQPTGEGSR